MLKVKKEKLVWAAFAIVAAVFLLAESTHFNYSISDENTYYLMGMETAQGRMPYRDYFFSHPPLQIFLFAAIIRTFGFNFILLKSTEAIATIITAFFIFKLAKERFNNTSAIVSVLLLFFSYDALRYANFPTGVCLTTMFISAGLYYYLKEKHFASGLLMGFAGITGIYSLIAAAVLGAMLITKKKELLKFAAGFLLVFLTVNMLFLAVAGRDYLMQTVAYHLKKPAQETSKLSVFARQIKVNWLLFLSPLLILGKKIKKEIMIAAAIIAAYLLFFTFLSSTFGYYSMLIFPLLAIAGGCGLNDLMEKYKTAAAVAVILLFLFSISSVNNFAKNDFQDFKEAGEIARFVKENSNSSEEIFGDDSTTPLISLLSGRRIALNFIDSNPMRFESGTENISKTIQELKESNLKFALARKLNLGEGSLTYGVAMLDGFAQFINGCNETKKFETNWNGAVKEFYIYECQTKQQ